MQNPTDSVVDDLHTALDHADDAEVRFHIRQALQHVETERVPAEESD